MKYILFSFIFLLVYSLSVQNSFSQDANDTAPSTAPADSTEKKKEDTETELKNLKAKYQKMLEDENNIAGEFTFVYKDPVPIYDMNGDSISGQKTLISKIIINLDEGYIRNIRAFTSDGKFFRLQSTWRYYSIRQYDYYSSQMYLISYNYKDIKPKENVRIKCYDFLKFFNLKDFYYVTQDEEITLINEGEKNKYNVKIRTLIGLINVKLFSDFLGLFGKEPNGILQTEISTKIPLITNDEASYSPNFILPYTELFLRISKIDDSKDFSGLTNDSILQRQNLLQKSWFTFGLNLNLVNYIRTTRQDKAKVQDENLGLIIGGELLKSKLEVKKDSVVDFNLYSVHSKLYYNTLFNNNLGLNLEEKLIYEILSKPSGYKNDGNRFVNNFNCMLYYKPGTANSSYLYFRLSMYNSLDPDPITEERPFYKFQFGYSVNFNLNLF